jgi:multiple sugar transport system permease protein
MEMEMKPGINSKASPKASYITQSRIDAGKCVRTAVMLVLTFCMAYPFLWMIAASFTEEVQIFNFPFKLIPNPINTQGYKDVWKHTTLGYPMSVYFLNSLKVTAIGMVGSLISSALAAYGYSKINFPGRDKIFLLKLSTMMIPVQVTMLPTFIIYRKLGLLDTHAALYIGTFFGATFGTFLLRQFFVTIPIELNEAAEIDGAGHFRIFWQIILPLAKPALATLVILNFTSLWNSYETPLLYLRSPKLYTLPIALKVISEDKDVIRYAGVMAGSVSSALPVVAIFIACQKYFIGGVVNSGVKG